MQKILLAVTITKRGTPLTGNTSMSHRTDMAHEPPHKAFIYCAAIMRVQRFRALENFALGIDWHAICQHHLSHIQSITLGGSHQTKITPFYACQARNCLVPSSPCALLPSSCCKRVSPSHPFPERKDIPEPNDNTPQTHGGICCNTSRRRGT